MRIDNNQKCSSGAHPQCDESLLALRIWIFTRKGKVICKHSGSFSKRHTMRLQIGSRLCRIPLDMHEFIVCTNVYLSSIGHFNVPQSPPSNFIFPILKNLT